MGRAATKSWWLVELRGVFAIIFGLCAIFLPMLSLAWLIWLFAAFVAADGVLCLVASCMARLQDEPWGLAASAGFAFMVIAAAALQARTASAAGALVLAIVWSAAYAVVLLAAVAQSHGGRGRAATGAAGVVCLLLGAALWTQAPLPGVTILHWVGYFALALGCLRLALAAQLQGFSEASATELTGG
jgi:uncharacterized membrane protein HdeD (DUF308 family)